MSDSWSTDRPKVLRDTISSCSSRVLSFLPLLYIWVGSRCATSCITHSLGLDTCCRRSPGSRFSSRAWASASSFRIASLASYLASRVTIIVSATCSVLLGPAWSCWTCRDLLNLLEPVGTCWSLLVNISGHPPCDTSLGILPGNPLLETFLEILSGPPLWVTSVGNLIGEPLWDTSLGNFFGNSRWETSLGNLSVKPVWDASMGILSVKPLWDTSLGNLTGISFVDILLEPSGTCCTCWYCLNPLGLAWTCWNLLRPAVLCGALLGPAAFAGTCWDMLKRAGTCWNLLEPARNFMVVVQHVLGRFHGLVPGSYSLAIGGMPNTSHVSYGAAMGTADTRGFSVTPSPYRRITRTTSAIRWARPVLRSVANDSVPRCAAT